MPEQTIYIFLIVQAVMLVAIAALAVLIAGQRNLRRDIAEQVGAKVEEADEAFDGKLTVLRQELDGKITHVGDTVVDWLGKQNQAFVEGIDRMRDTVDKTLTTGRTEMEERLKNVTGQVDKRIAEMVSEINRRLEANVDVIQKANENFSQRIEASTKVFSEVKQELGKIEEAQRNISKVGLQVEELAVILQAPKARGGFGEAFLVDFLEQHLPKEHYELQHSFADGQTVDAVIKLVGGMVSVDAKFPLENFRRLISGKEGADIEKGAKVRFRNDVKKHVDDIARKYIRPTEGTFEFAFMYVPAENVYYEIVTAEFEGERPLSDYGVGKRVIPVSPNNFFAYLMTVAIGLKGMQLEERTKEVLAKLSQLNNEMQIISGDYKILGTHLKNAAQKYGETNRKLDKFTDNLGSLTEGTGEEGKPLAEDEETKAIGESGAFADA
jgi:DNA recombination protein RmuC